MNRKAIDFIKNFSYTLFSNLVSLLISALVVLVVPKLIGVEEYGYWQLYLFYTSYVGFLHFGWNDGVYLRYGGKEYDKLDKKLLFSQYHMLVISQLLIGMSIALLAVFFVRDPERMFIFQMTALCLVIVNSRYMLLFLLQATNRIKGYAQITILDRVTYLGLVLVLLAFGVREYKLMIVADLAGKFISLLFAMYSCRDIVFRRLSDFYFSFRETFLNISVGIKLMFSNIASKFVLGFVKFGIERSWDVATFGKVSLTLSVSNLVMLFINAIGLVMYPVLRRTREEKLSEIYTTMRDLLMVLLLGALVVYYPLKSTLSKWLPDYADSLNYMGMLFPIMVFEGKMSLLINTYLKALRMEKRILVVNVISLAVSALLTLITTVIIKDLDLAIISIVGLLAFRSIIAEVVLSKKLAIPVYKDIILEIIMSIIFISTAWLINTPMVMVFYGLAYLIYLCVKRSDICISIANLKQLLRS